MPIPQNKKISELTEKVIPVEDDLLVIVDTEAEPIETKKIKMQNVTGGNIFPPLIVGADTDTLNFIGKTALGYMQFASDYAGFSHYDWAFWESYAIMQAPDGATYINSAINTAVHIRNNGSVTDIATFTPSGITTSQGVVEARKDTDTMHIFGRVSLGGVPGASDYALYAHVDCANVYNYALLQGSDGASYFNAASGLAVHIRIGGSTTDIAQFDTNGLTLVTGIISARANTDTNHYFGRCRIGCLTEASGYAAFTHYSRTTVANYGILLDSANTFINAASGGSILFRNNNNNYGTLTPAGLTLVTGFGCNNAAPQTSYASGGAVATSAGAFGFGSDQERIDLTALVANIRSALIANGIMS